MWEKKRDRRWLRSSTRGVGFPDGSREKAEIAGGGSGRRRQGGGEGVFQQHWVREVENTMLMLTEDRSLAGVTVCDAGCGTGLLSIPLAKEGAIVSASDISAAMVAEAEMKATGIAGYWYLAGVPPWRC